MIRITRCVCFSKTFDELKRIADRERAKSIPELQEHVRFGLNCRLCHPYVRRMLQTGEVVFLEILTENSPENNGMDGVAEKQSAAHIVEKSEPTKNGGAS